MAVSPVDGDTITRKPRSASLPMLSRQKNPAFGCTSEAVIASHNATFLVVERRGMQRSPRNIRHHGGLSGNRMEEETMDGLIYLIGLIVIILAILSFFGLR
jgi:hypothetical protein